MQSAKYRLQARHDRMSGWNDRSASLTEATRRYAKLGGRSSYSRHKAAHQFEGYRSGCIGRIAGKHFRSSVQTILACQCKKSTLSPWIVSNRGIYQTIHIRTTPECHARFTAARSVPRRSAIGVRDDALSRMPWPGAHGPRHADQYAGRGEREMVWGAQQRSADVLWRSDFWSSATATKVSGLSVFVSMRLFIVMISRDARHCYSNWCGNRTDKY